MANEDNNRPQKPFNTTAAGTEKDIIFEPDFEDNLLNNADPRLEPTHKNHLERTPSGTKSVYKVPQSKERSSQSPKVSQYTDEEFQNELLNGDYTFEDKIGELRVRTKTENTPSKEGINGGVISKMILTSGDRGAENELARFEKGQWNLKANTPHQRQAIMEATHRHDKDCLKVKDRFNKAVSSIDQVKTSKFLDKKGKDYTR